MRFFYLHYFWIKSYIRMTTDRFLFSINLYIKANFSQGFIISEGAIISTSRQLT